MTTEYYTTSELEIAAEQLRQAKEAAKQIHVVQAHMRASDRVKLMIEKLTQQNTFAPRYREISTIVDNYSHKKHNPNL